jgi:inorganic pyrophosphatase
MANPWHDVSPGDDVEQFFYSVIEIPRGSKNKYELDKKTGLLMADRVLYSSVHYPANYGFIPQSYCDDGDPLDVLVLCQEPITSLCIVKCKAIGMITMSDEMGKDDKIIAVHANDPAYAGYDDISALPPHVMVELKRFFEDYKALEHKEVVIDNLKGRFDAVNCIREALQFYQKKAAELLK